MERRYAIWDVFTAKPLAGNPLAVVLDSGGLSTEQMQAIAREFNLSETVFVLPPRLPAHTAYIRIFTPYTELQFAGHPTVGAAIQLADDRISGAAADCDALVVLEEGIGSVRVGVVGRRGQAPYAEFDVPRLPELSGRRLMKTASRPLWAFRRKRSALPIIARRNTRPARPLLSCPSVDWKRLPARKSWLRIGMRRFTARVARYSCIAAKPSSIPPHSTRGCSRRG